MRTNEEMIDALRELVRIPSVAGVDVTPEAPYGKNSAQALQAALDLCASLGMRTVNRDGQVGWAEIGQGDEMVGILVHLDVVPAGEGWTFDPFGGEIRDGKTYVNGKALDESYIREPFHTNLPKTTVPAGHIFVMGDNRNNSEDSRFRDVGFVDLSLVKGKASLIFWPLGQIRALP